MESAVEPFEPPPDRVRLLQPRNVFSSQQHTLPGALLASLREFSDAQHVTPFTTLFAAFAALLSRHSVQPQFFVGASLSNLQYPGN